MAADFGDEPITVEVIEKFLTESFKYSKTHYRGWPRGFQAGVGVICILISNNIAEDAMTYCKELKAGKKWAGFAIPVTVNSSTSQSYYFEKNPIWGRIYYPYFSQLIKDLT